MLRIIQSGLGRPFSYPVDPNATFQPGMICQLKTVGNEVVAGVSDGIAPLGIIDDVKESAMVKPVIDEIIIIPAGSVDYDGYNFTAGVESIGLLQNSNIVETSWVIDQPGLTLNAVNGAVIVPAGTILNYILPGSSTPNAVKAKARYSYTVPNMPGDDTTAASGRVTIWFQRGIFQTDQYETTSPYAVNAVLFVSANGKLTTEATMPNQPGVAMCLVPPSAHNTMLEFMWM